MAISGDTIVVGAPVEDAGGSSAGAAYVFQRAQGGADNWGEVTKLTASDAEANDFFGSSVAVSGDSAVVGARFEDAGGSNAGAAYVFQRAQGGADNWGEVKKLTASDAQAGDLFGQRVAISSDTVVVGAAGALGHDNPGAAYVFEFAPADSDGDGVPDDVDACPAEDSTGFDADNDGCLDSIENLGVFIDTLFDEAAIDATMKNSLRAKIDAAVASSTRDNVCAAVNQLDALKNQIEAQTGKKVSEDAALLLLAYITNVQNFMLAGIAPETC